ncbi:gamma-aminobutyric acid type B receptor subunit 2 [Thrips palmi]|uniref:Gamma-aminobutyric acid type B receptor subunit 2 n=1 Tax=Thrips palmi TaxID=161013 RepID=A0A6P8YHA7_THRPL|nr:gamma-aminobutyric acid type B receptor subunit 2 [Thrips palmi]
MPSVKLAVDHINENQAVLRNYRLHMWWNDTQCNAAVGVKAFFDMMHKGPPKVMLFGAACTHVTDPIAKASKHWRLTQLSYADTHPMFTSESFPNFFRVVPSENAFNLPRLKLLQQFNWTRVGTIYQNEPRYSLAHNRLVADLDTLGFQVAEAQSFATDVSDAIEKLKAKDIRIVLGNFNETWARRIFCQAHKVGMVGRKFQWLIMGTYTEHWWTEPDDKLDCSQEDISAALEGCILTDLLPLSTSGEITVSGITADEYMAEYNLRRDKEYSRFHGYTYDGVWAVALAIQHAAHRIRHYRKNDTMSNFKYRDAMWEKVFLEALKNTSFEGVTGPVRFYDNERKANILLKQFQGGEEIKVGEFNGVTEQLDMARGHPVLWQGGRGMPPKDRTLHQIQHSQINLTVYVLLASCASIGMLLGSFFLIVNIRYRNQRYIKMSSPHLNNLIIVGCLLTYSSVIFLGLDSQLTSIETFPYICTARAWLLMAGFSLAFGAMFSKTWRVHSIFTDVKLNKKVIKDYQLFMVVGVLLFIDLGIMTTWQIAYPFYRETKQMEPYTHPSSEDIKIIQENEYCMSERMTVFVGSIYAYKGLLMIFGAFLAWETRHVSIPALNDSKYVGMSVYNVVIMCVMGAAISFVLSDKQEASFIIISSFILFCTTGTLCLVFVPKLVELRRNPQGSIDKRMIRATLRPMSKRRDSTTSEMEERIREAKALNAKNRKLLLDRESEYQVLLRRVGGMDGQTALEGEPMDRLAVPKTETLIRREGVLGAPSATETTDISSINSAETEYVSLGAETPGQSRKRSLVAAAKIAEEGRRGSVAAVQELSQSRRASQQEAGLYVREASRDSEPQEDDDDGAGRYPPSSPASSAAVSGGGAQLSKVVSFSDVTDTPYEDADYGDEEDEDDEDTTPRHRAHHHRGHRHSAAAGSSPGSAGSAAVRRRSSVKSSSESGSGGPCAKRRTSVPAAMMRTVPGVPGESHTLGRRSPRNPQFVHQDELWLSQRPARGASPSGGATPPQGQGQMPAAAPGPHARGGSPHASSPYLLNGGDEEDREVDRRPSLNYLSNNSSTPSVPAAVLAERDRGYDYGSERGSDRGSERGSTAGLIQRAASERGRDKCCHHGSGGSSGPHHHHYPSSQPNHHHHHHHHGHHHHHHSRGRSSTGGSAEDTTVSTAVERQACVRHAYRPALQQQSSLAHVQSTPDVARPYGHHHHHHHHHRDHHRDHRDAVGGGMNSAVSEGELLDLAILPIFQKLLTERHKSRSGYGASIASCPNISIKCDIVEYL